MRGTPPKKPTRKSPLPPSPSSVVGSPPRLPPRLPPPPPRVPTSQQDPHVEVHVDFPLDEQATAERNARVILYQKLAACVDHLSLRRATDFVEIGCIYADEDDEGGDRMLRVCRALQRP